MKNKVLDIAQSNADLWISWIEEDGYEEGIFAPSENN